MGDQEGETVTKYARSDSLIFGEGGVKGGTLQRIMEWLLTENTGIDVNSRLNCVS